MKPERQRQIVFVHGSHEHGRERRIKFDICVRERVTILLPTQVRVAELESLALERTTSGSRGVRHHCTRAIRIKIALMLTFLRRP